MSTPSSRFVRSPSAYVTITATPVINTFSVIRRRTFMPEMKATIPDTATIIAPLSPRRPHRVHTEQYRHHGHERPDQIAETDNRAGHQRAPGGRAGHCLAEEAASRVLGLPQVGLRARADVGASGHGQGSRDADGEAGGDDGDWAVERREEAAHGAEDLDEAVIESEEHVAHGVEIDAPLAGARDKGVLVSEFVLQHLSHGRPQRPIAVARPDVQVLPHAVDFDRLEHDVDRGAAEDPAGDDGERVRCRTWSTRSTKTTSSLKERMFTSRA